MARLNAAVHVSDSHAVKCNRIRAPEDKSRRQIWIDDEKVMQVGFSKVGSLTLFYLHSEKYSGETEVICLRSAIGGRSVKGHRVKSRSQIRH